MPYTIEPNPVRLRIRQQNLNKSDKAQYDLINSPIHREWDILLLQEPYIDAYGNTKATSRWHTVYPSSHLSDNSTKCSVILVNANLDSNSWAQIPFNNSNDVTVVQIRTAQGRVTIFNVYNDCTHLETMHKMRSFLFDQHSTLMLQESDHLVWCGDFNCHHPMWDEESNSHLFTTAATARADPLISLLADFGMVMALPKGVPTLQSLATGNWTRVDNVFVSEGLADQVVICDTDPRQRGPGTDHVPVLTTIEFAIPARSEETRRNFRETDWEKFREELAEQLSDIPAPQKIHTDMQFQRAVEDLMQAVQEAIAAVVPVSQPTPHSRRWWSKELLSLKKAVNRLSNKAYKMQTLADHPVHGEYRKIHNDYGDAIKSAKAVHCTAFLEGMTGKELWSANWYISNPIVVNGSGEPVELCTDAEKGVAFCNIFFPNRLMASLVPLDPMYLLSVEYKFELSREQLHQHIARLQPFKATREDGIPNIVVKEVQDLLAEYLLWIFCATFDLGMYSGRWQSWDTIVLRKPGKPQYDIPKAYRPIALANTFGKLLSSIIAEDVSYMCEKYQLLPANHFRGRPGQNTCDAMHLLVHKIKGAWRRHKVMAMLFLDVEGAFPNAVTARLLHNMWMSRVSVKYVSFMEHMLTGNCTRLKFDGYVSDWKSINNGIVQGDPLSMILYLFYNANLIEGPKKSEAKVTYVDDANFYAEGNTFEEAYDKIWDMMVREGGGQDWSKYHNSSYEVSKLKLVGFSRRQVRDPGNPGKTIPEPRPSLDLQGTCIKPSNSHKYLGVIFDQELRWKEQTDNVVAKATSWTLCFQRLARPAMGIKSELMCRLFLAVAVPRFTYAADIWFTPICRKLDKARGSGSVGTAKRLTSIQRIATLAITGAIRSTASDIMEAHAYLAPIELLLDKVCHRSTLRMASLPAEHPLHKLVRQSARRLAC